MSRDHWTPLSILGGSAIIALGIYFGLRERPVIVGTTGASSSASAASPSASAAPTGSAVATTSAPAVAPSAVVDGEVKKATSALAKTMSERCYAPHANDKEIPKHIHIIYSGTFDAAGKEVARGISDSREDAYPPVSRCLRELPMDLAIAPPGRSVNVIEALELP